MQISLCIQTYSNIIATLIEKNLHATSNLQSLSLSLLLTLQCNYQSSIYVSENKENCFEVFGLTKYHVHCLCLFRPLKLPISSEILYSYFMPV